MAAVFGIGGFIAFGLPTTLNGNPFAPADLPVANLMSWVARRQRRRLLDAQQGIDSVPVLGWRQFEQLAVEAFPRREYAVEETDLGGADGGIDLVLHEAGRRVLVQCKQWRWRQIPVNVVREMYGLLTRHKADAVKIACVGAFTRNAGAASVSPPQESKKAGASRRPLLLQQ